MLEAETRAARGVDFDGARQPDRVRIGAGLGAALCASAAPEAMMDAEAMNAHAKDARMVDLPL